MIDFKDCIEIAHRRRHLKHSAVKISLDLNMSVSSVYRHLRRFDKFYNEDLIKLMQMFGKRGDYDVHKGYSTN